MRWYWILALALTGGCRKDAKKVGPADDAALPADAAASDAAPVDARSYELLERSDAGPPDIDIPDLVTDDKQSPDPAL